MQVQWEKIVDNVHRGHYRMTVPSAEVGKGLDSVLKKHATSIKVKGFRVGKAPRKKLINTIGKEQVSDSLKTVLKEDAFKELVNKEKIKTVGPPMYKDISFDFDGEYIFSVEFAKEIKKVIPKHEHQTPVISNIGGGLQEIRDRVSGSQNSDHQSIDEHLPEELDGFMPDQIASSAKQEIEQLRNPTDAYLSEKPKITQPEYSPDPEAKLEPESQMKESPHEALDEKAKAPDTDMAEMLPETEKGVKTDIDLPDADEKVETKDLKPEIESPSPSEESISPLNENDHSILNNANLEDKRDV